MAMGTKRFDGVDLMTLIMGAAERDLTISPALACRMTAAVCEQLHAWHSLVDDSGTKRPQVHGGLSIQLVLVGRDGSIEVARLPSGLESLGQQTPEQLEGQPADVRSDVFTAGLVLYVLLVNDHPFVRETDEESDRATRACALAPPSQLAPVPEALDAVVMRALARAPGDRYADALSFGRALEEAQRTLGLEASQEALAELVRVACPPDSRPEGDGPTSAAEVLALLDGLAPRSGAPREIETYFDDHHVERGATLPQTVALASGLLDLGFTRLGMKIEVNDQTGEKVAELSFAAASKQAFAGIWFKTDTHAPHLYFYTAFEGGEVVLTRSYALPTLRTAKVVVLAVPNRPIPEVLEAHRAEVAALKARGCVPLSGWGRDERLETTRAYYRHPDTPK
jgi:hypothetical protein